MKTHPASWALLAVFAAACNTTGTAGAPPPAMNPCEDAGGHCALGLVDFTCVGDLVEFDDSCGLVRCCASWNSCGFFGPVADSGRCLDLDALAAMPDRDASVDGLADEAPADRGNNQDVGPLADGATDATASE